LPDSVFDETLNSSGRKAGKRSETETGSRAERKNCQIPRQSVSEAKVEEAGKQRLLPDNERHVRAEASPPKANAGQDTESSQANWRPFGAASEPDAGKRKEWP
jgi:hypothetical protein